MVVQRWPSPPKKSIPRPDATWTISNTSIATVTTNANGTAVVTGVAAGQVMLTATAEGVTAQEQVTILSQSSFTSGTTIWSAPPPLPGYSVIQLAQAVPSANGPGLYSISLSADGTQSIIQALQADGEQLWQSPMPPLIGNSVPDGSGGLIVTTCASGNPMTVLDLNATGEILWQQAAAEVNGLGYICYPAPIAVNGAGVVFIAEPTNAGLPSLTIAYPNGYIESTQFQPSTVNSTQIDCCVGPPMVNIDGTVYLEYEVRNTNNNVITSDTLFLYNATTTSSVVISGTIQNEALLPGPIIPDGQGGILVTWTISAPAVVPYPYQFADVTTGVVGAAHSLPFSPQSVGFGQSPTLVLGENGVAFAKGPTTVTVNGVATAVDQIASFNISSGAANWTYQATSGDILNIVEATGDGGVTINDSNTGVIQLSSVGNISSSNAIRLNKDAGIRANASTSGISALQGAVPYNLSTWMSTASGIVNAIWNPNGANGIPTVLAQSVSPMPHGNQQGQNQPPFCQRTNVSCALAPHSDGQADDQYSRGILVRRVTYWLFNLQNGMLSPLEGNSVTPPPVKIEEWEANSSNPNVSVCSWQSQNTICETPDTAEGGLDGPGQITDNMGAGFSTPFTIQQQFLVDRQGVQVFWPYSGSIWYGAWGTPSSSPPGFQPNQSTNTTAGWATISQINANTNAPTACPSGCDTTPPQAGPPSP